VDLDPVEACVESVRGSLAVLLHDAWNLVERDRARRRMLDATERRARPALRGNDRWCHRRLAAGLNGNMRAASGMPKLNKDAAAACMDGVGHQPPSSDLVARVDTR
jgi:hypothetical protein